MKLLKYLVAVGALAVGLTLSAQADLVDLGGIAKTGGNSPTDNFNELTAFLAAQTPPVSTEGFVLCGDSDNGDFGNPITNPISVMAGAYLVVHYGKGDIKGGNPGGQIEFFHVINGETSVDVPLFGPGPFGVGGISSIREFCPPTTAPDSGTTAMLLGSALAGLGLVRRYLKR